VTSELRGQNRSGCINVPEARVPEIRVPQVSPFLRDLGAAATTLAPEPRKPRTNPNLNARTGSTKSTQALGHE